MYGANVDKCGTSISLRNDALLCYVIKLVEQCRRNCFVDTNWCVTQERERAQKETAQHQHH